MTVIKQDLEIAELASSIGTHLSQVGLGTIQIHDGLVTTEDIVPPMISLYFLPNGPEPFQLGNTTERLYKRVLQLDIYMESRVKVSTIIDVLMDYLDLTAIYIKDPLNNDAVIGSLTCQDTDSIYGQVVTPNVEKPKVIRWRGIVRATLEAHYPNG